MTPEAKQCCQPARTAGSEGPSSAPALALSELGPAALKEAAVEIPGGKALVGTKDVGIPDDGEGPQRRVRVARFRMGRTTVTNAEFAAFVAATGYVTEAEVFGWSFVFWSEVPKAVGDTRAVVGTEWWRQVEGANWRDINGPNTQKDVYFADHPVVQVSWNDAQAYAAWAGGRLASEAEWEHAARGGLGDVTFPWGEAEPNDHDTFPCNIWQGRFPDQNSNADGYATTAPAQSFAPNGYGLYNMAGNVWEWTQEPFSIRSLKRNVKQRLSGMKGYKLSKGGSFLCHKSYCYRYRIAARSGTSPDSTTTHQGFRMVWPDKP
ncbi:MAG: formylglycine-generating enzyme family protein [Thalassovita sp.]